LAFALSANCANASECVGDDCELDTVVEPIVIEENINIGEITAPAWYEININDMSQQKQTCCMHDSNCPFDTVEECEVWYKKPVHKVSLEPRSEHLNPALMDNMLYAIYANCDVSANDDAMAPLLGRYKMLMNASQKCCTTGIVYKMQQAEISEYDIYEFLKDNANRFAIGERCMVLSNEEIAHNYSFGVTGQMVADVRNTCLCKNRKWFESLLQPFVDIYNRAPVFEDKPFPYTYTDGLQREITVFVNPEVQTTLGLLSACPD